MKYYSTTVKGLEHMVNEDSCAVTPRFAIVADGMGGENAGEVASGIALDHSISQLTTIDDDSIAQGMIECVATGDRFLIAHSMSHLETIGMATTIVMAMESNGILYVCWCGDSRCFVYNINSRKITFSTRDHSLVRELVDNGIISERESLTHPDSNIITRYMGQGDEYAVPECAIYKLMKGDVVLLCSDGLSGYCTYDDIITVLNLRRFKPKQICRKLEELALTHGSEDDITIIVSTPFGETPNLWNQWFGF